MPENVLNTTTSINHARGSPGTLLQERSFYCLYSVRIKQRHIFKKRSRTVAPMVFKVSEKVSHVYRRVTKDTTSRAKLLLSSQCPYETKTYIQEETKDSSFYGLQSIRKNQVMYTGESPRTVFQERSFYCFLSVHIKQKHIFKKSSRTVAPMVFKVSEKVRHLYRRVTKEGIKERRFYYL